MTATRPEPDEGPPGAAATHRVPRMWLWIGVGLGALLLIVSVAYGVALLVFGSFGTTGSALFGTPVGVGVALPLTTAQATPPATGSGPNEGPPAATVPAALLREDFADEQSSTLLAGGDAEARYSFQDGAYEVNLDQANQLAWSLLGGSYADVSTAVDATLRASAENSAAALLFRYQDSDNFYIFNVAKNGTYSLELRRNSQWTQLIDWTPSPAIRGLNQPNRLRVDAAGDTFTLYVNDTRLGAATDDTFQSGKLALAVNTFDDGGARVAFDNLLVQGN